MHVSLHCKHLDCKSLIILQHKTEEKLIYNEEQSFRSKFIFSLHGIVLIGSVRRQLHFYFLFVAMWLLIKYIIYSALF